MDDGNKHGQGFSLCTQSYSKVENLLLVQALENKFKIDCSIHKDGKYYRIYIKKDSVNKFIELVKPYFHDSMDYKLK